jgi:hypothetical protein
MFRADDGSIHSNEDDMKAADRAYADAQRIAGYLASVTDWPRGEAARAERLISGFLAWERGEAPMDKLLDVAEEG